MHRTTKTSSSKLAVALLLSVAALACDGPSESIGEATDELVEGQRALEVARENAATEALIAEQVAEQEAERARTEAAQALEAAQQTAAETVETGAEAGQDATGDVQAPGALDGR